MPFFIKKPVRIEAVQWMGSNLREVTKFTGLSPRFSGWTWAAYEKDVLSNGLCIDTLEGTMTVTVGDWIINGGKGECCPCKSEIFAITYDPVDVRANK
jgi:hypothetical protein